MRRFFTLFIGFFLFSEILFAQEKPKAGDGTKESPYEISNAQELLWFAGVVNGTFDNIEKNTEACAILLDDIDLADVCGESIGSWTAIGSRKDFYNGIFDGKNHSIKNLYLNKSIDDIYIGFFGMCGGGAVIRNLTIKSGVIYTHDDLVGAIAGGASRSHIENCHNYITVTGGRFVGGIVGYLYGASVTLCHNEGDIYNYNERSAGGICGAASTKSSISYCYSTGNVEGESRIGGVVGDVLEGKVFKCFSYTKSKVKTWGYSEKESCYGTNYFYYDTAEDNAKCQEAKSKDDFASGEVCYLLNEGLDEPVFIQRIGTDSFPVLGSSYELSVLKGEEGYFNPVGIPDCEHTNIKTKEATCINGGYDYCTKCYKHIAGSETPALGHDTIITITNKPTCGKEGDCEKTCSRCETFLIKATLPALVHDTINREAVAPTCTKEGYTPLGCSLCKSSLGKTNIVPALGHDSLIIIHEANCRAYTRKEISCKRGDKFSIFGIDEHSEPTMNHSYVDGFCTVCGLPQSTQPDSADGYFLIKNARELLWFSEYVNARDQSANAKLIADIDLSEVCGEELKTNWLPINTSFSNGGYKGIFDGQHHSISNLYFHTNLISKDSAYYNTSDFNGGSVGLFSRNAGTIKNVRMINPDIQTKDNAGAIAANNSGTIYACSCEKGSIYTAKGRVGGICGYSQGKVIACFSSVTPLYSSGSYLGGIVGYVERNSILSNSLSAIPNADWYIYYICSEGDFTRCYHTAPTSYNQDKYYKRNSVLKKGEVCYLLNLGLEEPVWVQNLGIDTIPHLITNEIDKFVNLTSCTWLCPNSEIVEVYSNCTKDEMFVNNDTILVHPNHINKDDDPIRYDCCGVITDEYMSEFSSDTIKIYTTEDFILFRDLVNSGKTELNALMMNDIDLSYVCSEKLGSWKPVEQFFGTFNGQHHKIEGLYVNVENEDLVGFEKGWFAPYNVKEECIGLFRQNGGTIMNLGIGSSCTFKAHSQVIGAICGKNASWNHYRATITGCFNEADIKTYYGSASGIVGYNDGGEITNCYNAGKMSSKDYMAGIASNMCGEVKFCHNFGTFDSLSINAYRGNSITYELECNYVNDSYSLADTVGTDWDYWEGRIHYVDADTFASGKVCYELNEKNGTIVWYQTLGKDPYPVLDPRHSIVLYNEETGEYYNDPNYKEPSNAGESNSESSCIVYVVSRKVFIVGGDLIRIIDMFGRDVTNLNGVLADGVYMVVCSDGVTKVVVR